MSIIKANKWQSVAGIEYKSVIQVVQLPFNTTYSTTSNGTWVAAASMNITTKAANSNILVFGQAQLYAEGTPSGFNISIRRDRDNALISHGDKASSEGNDIWQGWGHGSGIGTTSARLFVMGLDDNNSNPAGTTLSYTLMYGKWQGTTIWVNYSGYGAWSGLVAVEVLS